MLEAGQYKSVSATGLLVGRAGKLLRLIFTAAASTPTIKVWDSTAGSGTVLLDTFAPTVGMVLEVGAWFNTGIYITIGNTVSVTVVYE